MIKQGEKGLNLGFGTLKEKKERKRKKERKKERKEGKRGEKRDITHFGDIYFWLLGSHIGQPCAFVDHVTSTLHFIGAQELIGLHGARSVQFGGFPRDVIHYEAEAPEMNFFLQQSKVKSWIYKGCVVFSFKVKKSFVCVD